MTPKIMGFLGAIAVIPTLANLIHPQLAIASKTPQNVALSEDSLVQLESRTIQDDYRLFFQNRQNVSSEIFANIQTYNRYIDFTDGDDGVWRISEDVRLSLNEPLVESNSLVPPRRDLYDDLGRVEVQVDLVN